MDTVPVVKAAAHDHWVELAPGMDLGHPQDCRNLNGLDQKVVIPKISHK